MGKNKETAGSTTVVNQQTTPTPTPEEVEMNRLQLGQFRQTVEPQTQLQLAGLGLGQNLLQAKPLPGYLGQLPGGAQAPSQIDPLQTQIGQQEFTLSQDPTKFQGYNINPFAYRLNPKDFIITPELTTEIAQRSIQDIQPRFQARGLLDSGVNAAISARLAEETRRNIAESNLERTLGVESMNVQNALDIDRENIARNIALQQYQNELGLGVREANIERSLGAQQFNIGNQFSQEQFNINNLLQLLNQALGGQAEVQSPMVTQQANLGTRLAGLRSSTMNQTTNASSFTQKQNPFVTSFQESLGQSLGGGRFGSFKAGSPISNPFRFR